MRWTQTVRVSALAGMFAVGLAVGVVMSGAGAEAVQGPAAQQDTDALHVLMAKDAIREQIYNYARGLDRMDKALALSIWNPGATVDLGGREMSGPEWIESAWRTHEKIAAHAHTMGNIQIKVTGDTAVSETYLIASLRAEPTPESANTSLIRGRYVDRWSKRNGAWAMDHRRIIVDFQTNVASTTKNPPSAARRDKTDPSYAIF